ncbi:hypothetical protein EI94DRAFT_983971 [Lactarius quietus]|nr:hypothetical protein EI94DRAFT_983971 [Lactarius quietus]
MPGTSITITISGMSSLGTPAWAISRRGVRSSFICTLLATLPLVTVLRDVISVFFTPAPTTVSFIVPISVTVTMSGFMVAMPSLPILISFPFLIPAGLVARAAAPVAPVTTTTRPSPVVGPPFAASFLAVFFPGRRPMGPAEMCRREKEKKSIRSLVNICCGTVFRHSEKMASKRRSVSKANLSRRRTPLCNNHIWSARPPLLYYIICILLIAIEESKFRYY